MRPHQRDAIYRVVNDGTALLAHEVGFPSRLIGTRSRRVGTLDSPKRILSPVIPTRTALVAPQRPHRPLHKPQPEHPTPPHPTKAPCYEGIKS